LTTACLDLDGLIYHGSVLKVLRANEYKPELLPQSHAPAIKLYLPASAFGTPVPVFAGQSCCCDSPGGTNDPRLDYLFIQVGTIASVERDSIVLIGFPYDDTSKRATGRSGSSSSPKAIRNIIKKNGAGVLNNPEFGIDISKVAIYDIGDITPGLSIDDAYARLVTTVAEIVLRGGIPFVLGGSSELCPGVIAGLMACTAVPGAVGVVNISAHLDVRNTQSKGRSYRQLLEDNRFCPARIESSGSSCDGRLVVFGAQGGLCSSDHTKYITEKGGRIIWLSKDLRHASKPCDEQNSNTFKNVQKYSGHCVKSQKVFQNVLDELRLSRHGSNASDRAIYVSINASSIINNVSSSTMTGLSSIGLTTDEILDIAMTAGADSNVVGMDVCDMVIDLDDPHTARLFTDIFYRFSAGVAIRLAGQNPLPELNLGSDNNLGYSSQINGSQGSIYYHDDYRNNKPLKQGPPLYPGQGLSSGHGPGLHAPSSGRVKTFRSYYES